VRRDDLLRRRAIDLANAGDLIFATGSRRRRQPRARFVAIQRTNSREPAGRPQASDAYLGAVQNGRAPGEQQPHLPEVREMVLGAGRGARIAEREHGQAGVDQSAHQVGDLFWPRFRDAVHAPHGALQGIPRALSHRLVITVSPSQMAQPPVRQAGVLAEHISKARRDHRPRSGAQRGEIGKDREWRLCSDGLFVAPDHQRGTDGCIPVD